MSTREQQPPAQSLPLPPQVPPQPAMPSVDLLSRLPAEVTELRRRLASAEQALAEAQRRTGEAEQMEAALAEHARELARSNAELELFASVVSHDLRAPLTSIGGCAELLRELLADRLDVESAGFLNDIRDAVSHMGRLIQSLLVYSRVGKGGLTLSECDANHVLAAVLVDLRATISAARAQVTFAPLPIVRADERLLAQLFQNLIENGIKYHGPAEPALQVAASADAESWVFSIADNGIGIDPRHFERIFQVFQRLHDDESQYPGVGVGLATCKKIVDRHGGRIWVDSTPGTGSVFRFSLPRR